MINEAQVVGTIVLDIGDGLLLDIPFAQRDHRDRTECLPTLCDKGLATITIVETFQVDQHDIRVQQRERFSLKFAGRLDGDIPRNQNVEMLSDHRHSLRIVGNHQQ